MSEWAFAAAALGLVMLQHSGPRWLVVRAKPFNCPPCLTAWLAWTIGLACWLFAPTTTLVSALLAGPIGYAAGIISVDRMPWLFEHEQA